MDAFHTRLALAAIVLAELGSGTAAAATKEGAVVTLAGQTLAEVMAVPEKAIPGSLLRDAQAVAIVPRVIKAGFVVGGRRGEGVVMIRAENGAWGNPVFVTLTGGSLGWQIGVQSTDVVLVFKSKPSLDGFLKGKRLTLGVDAAVSAGPLGREAQAGTDGQLQSEIYSYSRSRGLFIGAALDGSVIDVDNGSNAAFYNRAGVADTDIISGVNINVPLEAAKLKAELTQAAVAAGAAR
jgi:SH3 domain-containing YSC84-like protein 1